MKKWFDDLNATIAPVIKLAVNLAVVFALVNVANSFRTNNVSQDDLDAFEVRVETQTNASLDEFRVDVDGRFEAVDGRFDRLESLINDSDQKNP